MSLDTSRRVHGGYVPMKARRWEKSHYTATWTRERPADDVWAWLDVSWQLDRGELMSERDLAEWLGWPRRRAQELVRDVLDAYRTWGLTVALPRRRGHQRSESGPEASQKRSTPKRKAAPAGAPPAPTGVPHDLPAGAVVAPPEAPSVVPVESRATAPTIQIRSESDPNVSPKPGQNRSIGPRDNAGNPSNGGPLERQSRAETGPEASHPRGRVSPTPPSTSTPPSTTPPQPPAERGAGVLATEEPPPTPPRTGGRVPSTPSLDGSGAVREPLVSQNSSQDEGGAAGGARRRARADGDRHRRPGPGEPWRPSPRDVRPHEPDDFCALVNDVVLAVTGKPWNPYAGETTARHVLSHWKRVGCPELGEYSRQVELIASAAREAPVHVFRNDIRGIRADGQRWGADRSRDLGTVLRQRPPAGSGGATWEDRLAAAEAWDAEGRPADRGPQPNRTDRGVYRSDTPDQHTGDDDAFAAF